MPRGTFYIQYETLEELGEGAFGKALKCRRRRDNQIFVVKIMHESKMSAKAIEEVMHCCVKVTTSIKHMYQATSSRVVSWNDANAMVNQAVFSSLYYACVLLSAYSARLEVSHASVLCT